MKAVLISIQPKWCELIASGKKTYEVRKTKPKLETPFKVYIYCTQDKRLLRKFDKGERIDDEHFFEEHVFVRQNTWIRGHLNPNKKVIGEFVCDRFVFLDAYYDTNGNRHLCNTAFLKSCVPNDELFDYLYGKHGKKHGGWAWHISNLVIYDKPKELSGFFHYCGDNPKCDGCEAHYFSNTECGKEDYCCSIIEGCKPLKRPPQSWCYVEEGADNEQREKA